MIYCDTSLLLSLYVADDWSAEAGALVAGAREPLVWTAWHELEFTAALEARVGRGANTREEVDAVMEELAAHRERDELYVPRKADWEEVLRRAAGLAGKRGAEFLCRSLDVLHVAACLELRVERFWSFDERQRRLAKAVGLEVNR